MSAIVKKLRSVDGACVSGCEGRCMVCPQGAIEEAATAIEQRDALIRELVESIDKAVELIGQFVEAAKQGTVPVVTISAFEDIKIMEQRVASYTAEGSCERRH